MCDQAQALRELIKAQSAPNMNVITVTGAKGGVGKSSVALNLSIALNKRGKRTLVVDMDLGLANIDVMLGTKTEYDLLSVIEGSRDIHDIIGTGICGVKYISGGSGMEELVNLDETAVGRIITQLLCLEDVADTIIFDTGAGISEIILRLISASNDTLLVTMPEPTSFMDAYALVKIMSQRKINPNIKLIINKADTEREAQSAAEGFISIAEKYSGIAIKHLGYILNDEHMVRAVKLQVPLLVSFPASKAARNLELLADTYMDIKTPDETGLMGFLKRLFGGQ